MRRAGVRAPVRALFRRDEGAELAEFVVTMPILLLLIFGVIEIGNALEKAHTMSSLSREGANIAVRGTDLDTVVALTMANGGVIDLPNRGGTVVSRVVVSSGAATVMEQVYSTGYATLSRIGLVDSLATGFASAGLVDGQELYVVEVFYDHQKVTPLSRLFAPVVPDTMYELAVF